MKLIGVRDKQNLLIDYHPHAESLNKKLITESSTWKYPNRLHTNIHGEKWSTNNKDKSNPSQLVFEWATTLLRNYFRVGSDSLAMKYDVEMWFAKYDKGDHAKEHHHLPFALFSFVYFINCPRGSSPLIFKASGKRIKAEEGKIVVFSSNLKHYVPKNRCENRLVLAGNMRTQLRDATV